MHVAFGEFENFVEVELFALIPERIGFFVYLGNFQTLSQNLERRALIGYLRFFLAFLVMISHVGTRFWGMNPGVWAVVVFYILAGHVITHLLLDIFWGNGKNAKYYYIDRILRIFPLYLFICGLTSLFLIVTDFGNPQFKPVNCINNFLIVPLNYYMYDFNKIVILTGTNPPWWLIPPAWSLGAEVQTYFMLPFLLKWKKLGIVTVLLSLTVYSAANLSLIHSDYFGYRLLPGVIFIFIVGSLIQKTATGTAEKYEKLTLISVYIFCLLWFIYFVLIKGIYGAYTRETLLGVLIGSPLVYTGIKLRKKRLPFNRLAGNLSYGLFLSHFPSIWLLEWAGLKENSHLFLPVLFLVSTFFAFIGVKLIDEKIERFRFQLSRKA